MTGEPLTQKSGQAPPWQKHWSLQSLLTVILCCAAPAKADTPLIYLRDIGSQGTGPGQYARPIGIDVDDAGNVFVADGGRHRILKYSSLGQFLGSFGDSGSGDGHFDFPSDIAVDATGQIFVGDARNMRIQVFDPTFAYVRQWSTLDAPTYFALTSDQGGLVSNPRPLVVRYSTSTGAFVTGWQYAFGLGLAYGFGVDAADTLYLSDADRVSKYSPDGTLILGWGSGGTGPGQFTVAGGIVVDRWGRIHVGDGAGRIQTFGPDGSFRMEWGSAVLSGIATDMATDADGNIYVVNANRVIKFGRDLTPATRRTFGQLKTLYRHRESGGQ